MRATSTATGTAKQYEVDQVDEGAAFVYLSSEANSGDDDTGDDDTGDDDTGDDDDSAVDQGDDDTTVEQDDDDSTEPATWRLPSDERSFSGCRADHNPAPPRAPVWLLVVLLVGRRRRRAP